MRARAQLGFFYATSSQSIKKNSVIRLLIFDSIAQLLLGSKYIADSGGKYPSCFGLHREEGMVKSGFCFLNLSTQMDLRGEKS